MPLALCAVNDERRRSCEANCIGNWHLQRKEPTNTSLEYSIMVIVTALLCIEAHGMALDIAPVSHCPRKISEGRSDMPEGLIASAADFILALNLPRAMHCSLDPRKLREFSTSVRQVHLQPLTEPRYSPWLATERDPIAQCWNFIYF